MNHIDLLKEYISEDWIQFQLIFTRLTVFKFVLNSSIFIFFPHILLLLFLIYLYKILFRYFFYICDIVIYDVLPNMIPFNWIKLSYNTFNKFYILYFLIPFLFIFRFF